MSKDPANFNEKLDAWKEFHEAWSSTYREHLLRKKWPEGVIDLYEVVYQCLTQSRIRDDIIESGFQDPADGGFVMSRLTPRPP
jgi:hypothetical protein